MRLVTRRQHETEHERVERQLAEHEKQLVDFAARLVILEAEVGIYRPFFINEKGGE